MPKPTKFEAAFSDGKVIGRSSVSRTYTAAWRYTWTRDDGTTASRHGFAGDRSLAERAVATESRHAAGRPGFKTEVAAVVVVEKFTK